MITEACGPHTSASGHRQHPGQSSWAKSPSLGRRSSAPRPQGSAVLDTPQKWTRALGGLCDRPSPRQPALQLSHGPARTKAEISVSILLSLRTPSGGRQIFTEQVRE